MTALLGTNRLPVAARAVSRALPVSSAINHRLNGMGSVFVAPRSIFSRPSTLPTIFRNNLETVRVMSLHTAVCDGNLERLKTLLEENNADINKFDAEGKTPLHYAVAKKKPEIAQFLVDNGANPYIRSSDTVPLRRLTPLDMADGKGGTYPEVSEYKNYKLARYMVENYKGEKINTYRKR